MIRETEFLRQQAQRAKQRFADEARGLAHDLVDPLDPRPFVRRRPFVGIASFLAAGALAGIGLGSVRWHRKPARAKHEPAAAHAADRRAANPWTTALRRARSLLRVALTAAAFVRKSSGTEVAATASTPADETVPIG